MQNQESLIEFKHTFQLIKSNTPLDRQAVTPERICSIFALRNVEHRALLPGEAYLGYHDVLHTSSFTQCQGKFILTNYRLVFLASEYDFQLSTLIGWIAKFEKVVQKKETYLAVHRKLTKEVWKFKFARQDKLAEALSFGTAYLHVDKVKKDQFAYFYAKRIIQKLKLADRTAIRQKLDWNPKLLQNDMQRMVQQSKKNVKVYVNFICLSYPEQVLIPYYKKEALESLKKLQFINQTPLLSSGVDKLEIGITKIEKLLHVDQQYIDQSKIEEKIKLRERNRFPIVVYAKNESTILMRASHPKHLIHPDRMRHEPTLFFLSKITKASGTKTGYIHLVDSQNPSKFKDCESKYYEVKVVSTMPSSDMKESFKTLRSAFTALTFSEYAQVIDQSKWLQQIFHYLDIASILVFEIIKNQRSLIIDCPTGTDKSLVMSALVQVMLDPFYRTFEGFRVLVQKQFVKGGYQFANRNGVGQQQSPVFLFYLDCVHQLVNLYPLNFQFNFRYLSQIGYLSYSNRYGTFMFNSYKEIKDLDAEQQTSSIWHELLQEKNKFFNKFWNGSLTEPLIPSVTIRNSRVFKELFWRLGSNSEQSEFSQKSERQILQQIYYKSVKQLEQLGIQSQWKGD